MIDDRPFKAELDSKRADQQKAESALGDRQHNPRPLDGTAAEECRSQQDVDNGKAASEQAAAVLAAQRQRSNWRD